VTKNKYHIESLTPELIEKYHQGKLSEDEQYAVEKLMLNSSFDTEAMEGYEEESQLVHDLAMLNKRLDVRIAEEKKSTLSFWLKIAASIIILSISTYLIFDISFDKPINDQYISEANDQLKEESDIQIQIEEKVEEESPEPPKDLIAMNEVPVSEEQPPIINKPKQEVIKPVAKLDEQIVLDESVIADIEVDAEEELFIAEEIAEEPIQTAATKESKANSGLSKMEQQVPEVARESAETRRAPSKKKSELSTPNSISGKVTSADDGSALPGINVVIKGTTIGTVTDIDGNYTLDLPLNGEPELVFSFIGLASEEVKVGDKYHLDVAMEDDVVQLSEVVVTALGVKKESGALGYAISEVDTGYESAKPLIGMSSYKTYLIDSVRYPEITEIEKGKVVVKFDIEPDGSLTNFEIKKSLGEPFDNEAIRLVQEGSKWTPSKNNGAAVKSSARVTVKFDRNE
jgi:TonB family protein